MQPRNEPSIGVIQPIGVIEPREGGFEGHRDAALHSEEWARPDADAGFDAQRAFFRTFVRGVPLKRG
jgi:hypothetical protein